MQQNTAYKTISSLSFCSIYFYDNMSHPSGLLWVEIARKHAETHKSGG